MHTYRILEYKEEHVSVHTNVLKEVPRIICKLPCMYMHQKHKALARGEPGQNNCPLMLLLPIYSNFLKKVEEK